MSSQTRVQREMWLVLPATLVPNLVQMTVNNWCFLLQHWDWKYCMNHVNKCTPFNQIHCKWQRSSNIGEYSIPCWCPINTWECAQLLQILTLIMNYRLGGPDPLDYISMYDHPGIPELHIPPHWHYIRYTLTLDCYQAQLDHFVLHQFWPDRLARWWQSSRAFRTRVS